MIGPSGLLLVVPHLFELPGLVLGVGLKKSEELKLGCEKYVFLGHILSTIKAILRNTIHPKFPV
jgi:hypothetical protein